MHFIGENMHLVENLFSDAILLCRMWASKTKKRNVTSTLQKEGKMNYISAAVYILLMLSLAIGIKFAPRPGFNKDSLSMDAMTCLKGVMALFVVLHHLSQKKLFQETGTISVFEQIGFLFVGIFFFTSGYGLYKSFITKPNYLKGFLKRRVLPILISYYVMIAIYAVYYIIKGNDFSVAQWIFKLSGLILINSQAWFVPIIILMYLAFYFIFKSEKLRKNGIPILLAITLLQGLLFCAMNHFAWYLGSEPGWWMKDGAFDNIPWWGSFCVLPFEGEWWVNSTIGFVFGIALAKHEESFMDWLSNNFPLKFIGITVLLTFITSIGLLCLWNIGYWTEFDGSGSLGVKNKLICYAVQCIQVIITDIFIVALMRKLYVKNKLYAFFGKRTLEMYLMQEIALFGWAFLIEKDGAPIVQANNWNVVAYFAAVMATVIASATVCNIINKTLSKGLKK